MGITRAEYIMAQMSPVMLAWRASRKMIFPLAIFAVFVIVDFFFETEMLSLRFLSQLG